MLRALDLDPGNLDFLNAVAQFYLKRGKYQEAKPIAEQMIARHPSNRLGHNLLIMINREREAQR